MSLESCPVRRSSPEWSIAVIRDHDVATPALLCHKEPAPIIGPFRAWKPPIPYALKNQRGAGVFCVQKPLVGDFRYDELVLYGIRELAYQHQIFQFYKAPDNPDQ